MPTAADERRHEPGREADWQEAWELDFVAGERAGFVRLALLPNRRVCWYWAAVVEPDAPLLAVRHHEVALPRSSLEVRAEGLWSALVCETPMQHWSVGLEAFAVALDDPLDAWGDERGDLVPLGMDLEWEALSPPVPTDVPVEGYEQECGVTGELLIGAASYDVDGIGRRRHEWGAVDWWEGSWARPTPQPPLALRALVQVPDPDGRRPTAYVERGVADGRWYESVTPHPPGAPPPSERR